MLARHRQPLSDGYLRRSSGAIRVTGVRAMATNWPISSPTSPRRRASSSTSCAGPSMRTSTRNSRCRHCRAFVARLASPSSRRCCWRSATSRSTPPLPAPSIPSAVHCTLATSSPPPPLANMATASATATLNRPCQLPAPDRWYPNCDWCDRCASVVEKEPGPTGDLRARLAAMVATMVSAGYGVVPSSHDGLNVGSRATTPRCLPISSRCTIPPSSCPA